MNFPKSVSLSLTYRALVTQSGGGFKVAEVYLDANEVKPHEVLVSNSRQDTLYVGVRLTSTRLKLELLV